MEISPILDMYQMLEHYFPGGLVDKVQATLYLRERIGAVPCVPLFIRQFLGIVKMLPCLNLKNPVAVNTSCK